MNIGGDRFEVGAMIAKLRARALRMSRRDAYGESVIGEMTNDAAAEKSAAPEHRDDAVAHVPAREVAASQR
jgi:hypothetical protein